MTLKQWSEEPRTLAEKLAMEAVAGGAPARDFPWKGAKREPFVTLQNEGWKKRESVFRLSESKITVHFWESPYPRTTAPEGENEVATAKAARRTAA